MPGNTYEQLWLDIWERVRSYNNTGAEQINAFFSRLQPQAFSEGFLMLTADTEFIKNWVETHYVGLIQQALEEKYAVPFTVAIEVDSSAPYTPPVVQTGEIVSTEQTETLSSNSTQQFTQSQTHPTQHYPTDTTTQNEGLVSEYSFDNFVVGSSNRLAYSMALSVAETPGEEQLNPLFIYGKSGLGKTHLLRAIQNYVATNYPYMKTIYVDTMELVNDYTDAAIRGGGKEYSSFKQRYMDVDIILIDDVQGLQGKDETLNIVFQIFNHLTDRGKQVVLSADRAPKHIDIEERYRSRFSKGGLCDIQPPETETKLGIIKNFSETTKQKGNFNFELSSEVQEYVAQISSSNIRELKGAITTLFLHGQAFGEESLTINNVSEILKNNFSGGSMKLLTVSDIQGAVEKYFNISHADLVGSKRSANIAHARQVAIYLCRSMIDISYEAIGKEFNRDHTTIMYGFTQIEGKRRESRELNEELEIIQQMIKE